MQKCLAASLHPLLLSRRRTPLKPSLVSNRSLLPRSQLQRLSTGMVVQSRSPPAPPLQATAPALPTSFRNSPVPATFKIPRSLNPEAMSVLETRILLARSTSQAQPSFEEYL